MAMSNRRAPLGWTTLERKSTSVKGVSKPIALMNVMASVAIPVVQDGSQADQEHHRGAGIVRPELPIRELHCAGRDRSRWDVRPCDLQVL